MTQAAGTRRARRRSSRPWVLAGAAVALVGAIALVAVAAANPPSLDEIEPERFAAPGSVTVDAVEGRGATVYVQVDGEPVPGAELTGELGACEVTGPGGEAVAAEAIEDARTLESGGDRYWGEARFEPVVDGPHEVACDAPAATSAAVAPDMLGGVLVFVASAVGAGLLLLAAVALLAVGLLVRRPGSKGPAGP